MAEQSCKQCGCQCRGCDQGTLHLHVEIENLKQRLVERDRHIVTMETNFLSEADKFPEGEYAALREDLYTWQEKYSRLYESYKRVQKVNQGLEDKLLRVVDKCESEKGTLTRDVASLTQRLVDGRFNITRLQEENERYRNDLSLAIQLLQCKPANFVPQKFEQLPSELQQKVRVYMGSKRRPSDSNGLPPKVERRTIKVPIPTFPPTAMVYSVNKANEKDLSDEEKEIGEGKPPVDTVSAAILAKILEERERERLNTKHCESCTCQKNAGLVDVSTQTAPFVSSLTGYLCSRCNLEIQTPSPAVMNLRYSSSLLGSGEASQVLVSLADDPDALQISSHTSQSRNAKQSPRQSLINNSNPIMTPKQDDNNKRNENIEDSSRPAPDSTKKQFNNFDNNSWDDWNQNTSKKCAETKKNETNGQNQNNEILRVCNEVVDMPKVSTNSSPSFFRVSSSVMPSSLVGSSSSSSSSIWARQDNNSTQDAGRRLSRGHLHKGKHVFHQEPISNDMTNDVQETTPKENDSVYINMDSSRPGKESLNFNPTFQNNCSTSGNCRLKNNQTRFLPETKLFASGDTMEIFSADPTNAPNDPDVLKKDCGDRKMKNSTQGSKSENRDARPSGPRPCSLRFQAGSNNILLGNAHSYAPVLYTSRQHSSNADYKNHCGNRGNDALVHGVRSRSASASSNDDFWGQIEAPNTISATQRLPQRLPVGRTETGV